jgi:hypothetical protein
VASGVAADRYCPDENVEALEETNKQRNDDKENRAPYPLGNWEALQGQILRKFQNEIADVEYCAKPAPV